MKVVSNASPLINLAAVGRLDLLRRLYRRVIVPPAVWGEVVRRGAGRRGSRAVRRAPWIRVKAVRDRPLVEMLLGELDPGEAESIVLARGYAPTWSSWTRPGPGDQPRGWACPSLGWSGYSSRRPRKASLLTLLGR